MDKLQIIDTGNSTELYLDDAFGANGGRNYYLVTVTHGDPDELRANAAFIVRAVNSHQILVDGLKAALENGELGDWQSARLAINEALAAAEAA